MHKQPVQVHYLHRHGDRAPCNAIPQYMNNASFNCSWVVKQSVATSVPSSGVKTGTRFRVATVPDRSTYLGTCQLGQLTPVGGQQLFAAGTSLREIYGAAVLNPEKTFVQVTGDVRTHHSAASLMDGAFSGSQHAVPFSQADAKSEPLWQPHQCKTFKALEKKIVSQKKFIDFQNDQVIPVVHEIAESMNITLVDAWRMYNNSIDVWSALYCHNIESNVSLDLRLRAVQLSQTYAYMKYTDPQLASWSAAPFLSAMMTYLAAAGDSDFPTFLEWSGHDDTMQEVLGGLGVLPQAEWIPYAGHLRFEVWRAIANRDDMYVRAAYLNNIIDLPCADPKLGRGLCPLSSAMVYFKSLIPSDWMQRCGI
eukprot:PhM_4_TR13178/c0_g1_i1/m.7556